MGDHLPVRCDTSGRRVEGDGAKKGGNSVSRHVAIVGARRRTDRETVDRLVASLPADTVIMSGGAVGPDSWAAEAACKRGLATKIFRVIVL
jgi:predicted Rossmann fold nucleotide-binding protein DprA/Smf involved in DNA uptake